MIYIFNNVKIYIAQCGKLQMIMPKTLLHINKDMENMNKSKKGFTLQQA